MTELHFRDAREGDREAVKTLTLVAYQQYAAVMKTHWDGYRQNIVSTLDDVTPAAQVVAELDGVIVGTVLLYPAGMVFTAPNGASITTAAPEVRLLAVAPVARGHGVGAALIRECIRRARQSGAATLTLHTTEMMAVAMRMYERMGFIRAPELDFHPAKSITIKGYRLDLTEAA